MHSPARILHTPSNTANNPWGLSRAERELGFVSDVVDFAPLVMRYSADRTIDLTDRALPQRVAARANFFAHAVLHYDVFHYNAGAPLLGVRTPRRVFTELALVRRLRKKIVVTWQGCDVRPMEACEGCERPECAAQSRWRALDAAAMLRHADRAFYLNPDLGQYLPGAEFLPYASVDVAKVAPVPLRQREEVVVAHAPSSRTGKGTEHVIAAVDELIAEGAAIRLDLIEGVPHTEALARIAAADLLVDQLRIGWYGGVALEAMAFGRPVVCSIDQSVNPFGARLPIVDAEIGTLRDVLRDLISDRPRRLRLGEASRAFALEVHDPRVVARRVYEGLVTFPRASGD